MPQIFCNLCLKFQFGIFTMNKLIRVHKNIRGGTQKCRWIHIHIAEMEFLEIEPKPMKYTDKSIDLNRL